MLEWELDFFAGLESRHVIPDHVSYVDGGVRIHIHTSSLCTLYPNVVDIDTRIMSARWSVVFFDVLANHVADYALARGDCEQRSAILGSCIKEIKKSPLLEEHQVELPANLGLVCHPSIICCLTLSHFW